MNPGAAMSELFAWITGEELENSGHAMLDAFHDRVQLDRGINARIRWPTLTEKVRARNLKYSWQKFYLEGNLLRRPTQL
jgi:hypothetical protein